MTPSSAAAHVASPNAADHDITATAAATNPAAAPTGIVLNGKPELSKNGKEVCLSVNNTTNGPITLTWAVYSFSAGDFQHQTLVTSYNVTVPAHATNFQVCAPTVACAQFDLLQFDLVQSDLVAGGSALPTTYNAGTTSPPGKNDLISTTTGKPIPIIASVVTDCSMGEGKANEGLGNGIDPPPPGHAGDTQQNDDSGTPGDPNHGFNHA